jgi:hypothetical protein
MYTFVSLDAKHHAFQLYCVCLLICLFLFFLYLQEIMTSEVCKIAENAFHMSSLIFKFKVNVGYAPHVFVTECIQDVLFKTQPYMLHMNPFTHKNA